jgi:hypothetical protein
MGEQTHEARPEPAPAPPAVSRSVAEAAAPPLVAEILRLQSTAGNAAVGRLLARSPALAPVAETAKSVLDPYDHWYGLDHKGLGVDLLRRLPQQAALVQQVFGLVGWSNRDDVAEALCDAASDDQLRAIAREEAGRDALRRVVRELLSGYTSGNENRQMRRVMAIVSEQAPLVDSAVGKTLEIEVVTFDKGGTLMDWAGQKAAPVVWKAMFWRSKDRRNQFGSGARGHTAIIVGGLAYSYEGSGWRVGQNKVEYMTEATAHRPATSQVLLLPIDDARKIQRHLDAAANTGVYLLGGEICSDATGTALEEVLGKLSKDANPQHLKQQLAASGKVTSERVYAEGSNGVFTPKP